MHIKRIDEMVAYTEMDTVNINGKVWTARNLALTETPNGEKLVLGKDYFYPDGNESNVEEYGLLYTWDAAMRVVPDGWHLPSKEEFESLVNGDARHYDENGHLDLIGRNTINRKFNAINAGEYCHHYRAYYKGYWYFGKHGYFWSSTDCGAEEKRNMEYDERDIRWFMYCEHPNEMRMCFSGVLLGHSVRLVQD